MNGIDLERLQKAMADAEVDQSELARIVGCTPGAINQIVLGNVQRSKFLPDIAEALGVAVRWLRGEDVPRDTGAPIQPRAATPIQFVTLQVALPSEAALARMFLGLLKTSKTAKSMDEQALLLAKRLPNALSQLRDLLPDMAPTAPPPAERPPVLATPGREHR